MPRGIQVAKEGREVGRGQGKDLSFTSEAQSLKISEQFRDIVREVKLPIATNVLLTITHTLGYTPVFRLFAQQPSTGRWHGDSNSIDLLDDNTVDFTWKVLSLEATKIVIFINFPAAGTWRFKYWIFEDSLDV